MVREWMGAYLNDPAPLNNFWRQPYSVLTLCRMHYTAAHREIASKPAAAAWAMRSLDGRWAPLIETALRIRPEVHLRHREPADSQAIAATLNFIRYVLDYVRDKPTSDWKDRDSLWQPSGLHSDDEDQASNAAALSKENRGNYREDCERG